MGTNKTGGSKEATTRVAGCHNYRRSCVLHPPPPAFSKQPSTPQCLPASLLASARWLAPAHWVSRVGGVVGTDRQPPPRAADFAACGRVGAATRWAHAPPLSAPNVACSRTIPCFQMLLPTSRGRATQNKPYSRGRAAALFSLSPAPTRVVAHSVPPFPPTPAARPAIASRPRAAVIVDATSLQFIRGVVEPSVPDVSLTRARDGSSGIATFVFSEPAVFDASSDMGDITGLYMIDDEGELTTVDVQAKFVNGKPDRIEAKYVMRTAFEWDRFMRFMERYAEENELGFAKKAEKASS